MGENRFCTNCGAELVEDAVFCVNCGQPVEEADANPTETTVMPGMQEAFPETFTEPPYSQQPAKDSLESMEVSFQPPVSNAPNPTQYAVPTSPVAAPMPAGTQTPEDSSKIFTTVSIVIITLSLVASIGALIYLFMPMPNNVPQQGAAVSNGTGGNTGGSGTNGTSGSSNSGSGSNGTSGSSNSGSDTSGSSNPTQPTTTNTTPNTTTSQQQADNQFYSDRKSVV